ncbi:MAG: hypothetical protein WBW04_15150 [Nitrolancea sp.]
MSKQSEENQSRSRRSERRAAAEKQTKRRRQFTIGGVASVAILAALALIIIPQLGGGKDLGGIKIASAHPESIPSNGKVLGDPNAPVKIVEYGNYQ